MRGPSGIDFDKDGFIYLIAGFPDVWQYGALKKFNSDFQYISGFGTDWNDDTNPYNFYYPGDLAVNSKGDIYASIWGDAWSGGFRSRIKKSDANFQFQTRWYLDSVTGIAIDADDNVIGRPRAKKWVSINLILTEI